MGIVGNRVVSQSTESEAAIRSPGRKSGTKVETGESNREVDEFDFSNIGSGKQAFAVSGSMK